MRRLTLRVLSILVVFGGLIALSGCSNLFQKQVEKAEHSGNLALKVALPVVDRTAPNAPTKPLVQPVKQLASASRALATARTIPFSAYYIYVYVYPSDGAGYYFNFTNDGSGEINQTLNAYGVNFPAGQAEVDVYCYDQNWNFLAADWGYVQVPDDGTSVTADMVLKDRYNWNYSNNFSKYYAAPVETKMLYQDLSIDSDQLASQTADGGDWYSFYAMPGNVYTIDTYNSLYTDVDNVVEISDYNGNLLAKSDGTMAQDIVSFMPSVEGTYYLRVAGGPGIEIYDPNSGMYKYYDGEGNYSLYINEAHETIIQAYAGSGSTVWGVSYWGYPALGTSLGNLWGVVLDQQTGEVYFSDISNNVVGKVNKEGILEQVAGNGSSGYYGDEGPAMEAQLNYPTSLALYTDTITGSKKLYIADSSNSRVRMVDLDKGSITTVAGTGVYGYSGDEGPAIYAELNQPYGVTVDSEGNLYVADSYNYRIRKVDADGIISTVAGDGSYGYNGDDIPATGAQISEVYGLYVTDASLYFTDYSYGLVRKVDLYAGIITTIAGNPSLGQGYSGDGGLATSAQLSGIYSVLADPEGSVYVGGYTYIRKIDGQTGIIDTFAGNGIYGYSGDGGPARDASLTYALGLAGGQEGGFFADYANGMIRSLK